MKFLTSVLLGSTIGAFAAQVPLVAQQAPAFEVASIKPNRSETTVRSGGPQRGRFVQRNVTLLQLVRMAHSRGGLGRIEIAGGPDWIRSDRFDVEATIGGPFADDLGKLYLPDGNGSPGLAYQMLRTLLAERFGLETHNETRQLPTYRLVMSRSDGRTGARLQPSHVDCDAVLSEMARTGKPPALPDPLKGPPCSVSQRSGRLSGNAITMRQLADIVSPYVARPVFDGTGVSGNFDVSLEWAPAPGEYAGPGGADDAVPPPGDGLSIFTALDEQLGLRLQATTGPVDVLVIDRAEPPTPD
jgi:uncharacterized protein (TIGR03435 family)